MIQYAIIENGEVKEIFNTIEELTSNYKSDKTIYKDIIDYLNMKCNSNFRHTSKATQRIINSRIREGYTLEDFKKVINIKTNEWIDTNMEIYLRPHTLFGTKFESYINQKGVSNNGPNELSKFNTTKKSRELTTEERSAASELL